MRHFVDTALGRQAFCRHDTSSKKCIVDRAFRRQDNLSTQQVKSEIVRHERRCAHKFGLISEIRCV